MRVEIEVTESEHAKLVRLGREMNSRTPGEIARGIVGVFLQSIPVVKRRGRSDTSCAAAMLLAYKLFRKHDRLFSFESLAKAYDSRWPVHAIRARLSTLRSRGELNYRQVRPGLYRFTDVETASTSSSRRTRRSD